jgi:glucans biosynthesis protein C
MEERAASRVYFIDWVRILTVLLLFPFHTLRVFDEADPFYVKAVPVSFWVGRFLKVISVWQMALLFFLAGCSTYFALRKRSAGGYALERLKRLLVPFVFGFFILIPPQTWYGGRFNSGYLSSYWHYLASGDFLRWNVQDGGDYYGGFGIGHLWFIMFLFLISLIALVLAAWAARGRGVKPMAAFSRGLAHPAGWLGAVVILFVASFAPDLPGGPFVYYLVIFVIGLIAVCDPRFMQGAERWRLPSLVVGLGLTIFYAVGTTLRESFADFSWQALLMRFFWVVATWLMVVGLLGFGKRYLDRTSRTQRYLAEASYPVYILHQTVIVILAFYVVQMGAPRPVLWIVLLIGAVLGTFALYEIVRRVNVFRFLFGMKQRKRAPGAAPAPVSDLRGSPEPQPVAAEATSAAAPAQHQAGTPERTEAP